MLYGQLAQFDIGPQETLSAGLDRLGYAAVTTASPPTPSAGTSATPSRSSESTPASRSPGSPRSTPARACSQASRGVPGFACIGPAIAVASFIRPSAVRPRPLADTPVAPVWRARLRLEIARSRRVGSAPRLDTRIRRSRPVLAVIAAISIVLDPRSRYVEHAGAILPVAPADRRLGGAAADRRAGGTGVFVARGPDRAAGRAGRRRRRRPGGRGSTHVPGRCSATARTPSDCIRRRSAG
jgi:hypothetical protein